MRLENLSVTTHAGVTLLGPLTLEVAEPENLVVIGQSGAGKSTLLLALAGLGHHRVAGSIRIQQASGQSGRVLMGVQEASEAFTPYRRIGSQLLDAVAPAAKSDWDSRMEAALATLGLRPSVLKLYPNEASGGMLKRMLLAGLCCLRPRLLLLDEPTSGVDPTGRQAVWSLLCDSGIPFVVATHDLEALQALPHASAAVLHKGLLVRSGPATTLLEAVEAAP